jgi:hypothetical protein
MPTPFTISFIPGYNWTVGELVTEDKLNLAANPTVSLAGTITSTTIGDGVITPAKLNVSVAGNGLSGGGGTALAVNVDDSTIEINADTLRLKDVGITVAKLATTIISDIAVAKTTLVGADVMPLADSAAANVTKKITVTNLLAALTSLTVAGSYASAEISLASGVILAETSHNLGALPRVLRGVLVAQAAPEAGYTAGDEIDALGLVTSGSVPPFCLGANATKVFALCATTTPNILHKTTGTSFTITAAKWKFKLYARL